MIDVTSGGRGDLPGTTAASQSGPNNTSQGSQSAQSSATGAIDASINREIQGIDNTVQARLESTVPNEIVQTGFANVVSGIISTPAGMTNPSPGVVAAEDPIHAAEPATLILFASALALTARRLRPRR